MDIGELVPYKHTKDAWGEDSVGTLKVNTGLRGNATMSPQGVLYVEGSSPGL
jgi:hypothetical protein